MIDKKTSNQIDLLIKKLKDNELGSIKVTNKTNSIEITSTMSSTLQNVQQAPTKSFIQNSQPEESSNILSIPSLSAVYLTCSEPGLIPKSDFVIRFLSTACFAIDAALVKSS